MIRISTGASTSPLALGVIPSSHSGNKHYVDRCLDCPMIAGLFEGNTARYVWYILGEGVSGALSKQDSRRLLPSCTHSGVALIYITKIYDTWLLITGIIHDVDNVSHR
jgi:hypothetical protein